MTVTDSRQRHNGTSHILGVKLINHNCDQLTDLPSDKRGDSLRAVVNYSQSPPRLVLGVARSQESDRVSGVRKI